MTLFVCTAGTSIAGGPLRKDDDEPAYVARIEAKVASCRQAEPTKERFLVRVAAETNGLVRAGLQPDDEVVFLVTETDDGRLCGEALVRLVERSFNARARMTQVAHLQVTDGPRFRTTGVAELFATLDRVIGDRAVDEVRLNATGGFKGVVPYLVLYGMFNALPVSYVFEFSETLITLPPIPVEFEWDLVARAEEAIAKIVAEGAIPEDGWREMMPADYHLAPDRYDSLFEHDDGLVGLSAVGFLMKARLEKSRETCTVTLSPSAARAYQSAAGDARRHMTTMLRRVRNPVHRQDGRHRERLQNTDLLVWKTYSPPAPRMMYWVDGRVIRVGELFADHRGYDLHRLGSPPNRADYDISKFEELPPEPPEEDGEMALELAEQREEPQEQIAALEAELRTLREDLRVCRTERNHAVGRAREQAEARGHAAGRREAAGRYERELEHTRSAHETQIALYEQKVAELEARLAGRQ